MRISPSNEKYPVRPLIKKDEKRRKDEGPGKKERVRHVPAHAGGGKGQIARIRGNVRGCTEKRPLQEKGSGQAKGFSGRKKQKEMPRLPTAQKKKKKKKNRFFPEGLDGSKSVERGKKYRKGTRTIARRRMIRGRGGPKKLGKVSQRGGGVQAGSVDKPEPERKHRKELEKVENGTL